MPNALRFKSVLLLFYSNTKCSILRPVHRNKNSCSGLGSRTVAAQTETPIPAIPGSAYSWSYAAPPVWLMVIKLRRICLLGTRFAQIDSRQIGGPSLPRPSSSSIDFVSMLRRSNIFPLFAVDEEVACVCRATMEEIKRKNRPTTVFPPPARFIICSCWFSQILNMPIQTHPL